MATISFTSAYSDLNNWPGDLLRAGDDTVVTSRTATTFGFTLGGSSQFAGYKVLVTGTAFTYVDGVPISGTMTSVKLMGPGGLTLANITGLTGLIANDFDQFYSDVFGSSSGESGPVPDGQMAWSTLTSSNDTINGTAGDDRLFVAGYNAGNDVFNGRAGDDDFFGSLGNDTYNGGADSDHLSFYETTYSIGAGAIRGATINVNAGTVLDPWGGTDRFTSIEEFEGSRFNDRFIGHNTVRDHFSGLRGNDVIRGGDITFRSGVQTQDDRDRADYSADYWQGGKLGIIANLQTSLVDGSIRGTIRDGFGNTDTVIDIENVEGTRFNDIFRGSQVDNSFWGGQGRDSYVGGAGQDELNFERGFGGEGPTQGVNINLGLASGQIINDGFDNTENATGIEWIVGTRNNDRIILNAQNNEVQMLDGSDTVTGAGGRDTFVFNSQEELGDADRITDFAVSGAGADVLAFEVQDFIGMSTTLRLVNGLNATTTFGTFLFNAANDTLTWDSNGTGAGGRSVVAVLTDVNALSAANFELWG